MEWYWRLRLDLPPRQEDRRELERIAPELFLSERSAEGDRSSEAHEYPWHREFRDDVRRWLGTEEVQPRVTVREGSCPQHECPLQLDPASRRAFDRESGGNDPFVIELMTVAGGWSAKAKAFFDMTRKVHGGRGDVRDLLVTDPYIYFEQSEDGTAGGTESFLQYLDNLNVAPRSILKIHQPPYAKGDKEKAGDAWRERVQKHAEDNEFEVAFDFFRAISNARFHDRFYLARHADGSVSGLFGPSMSGLNDKSFALMGEIESLTMKKLLTHLEGWN